MTKKLNKTKQNKIKLNKIFELLNKNQDYMKNKKIFLIGFIIVFAATVALIAAFFNFNFNNYKTTVEIPFTKSFETYELEQIKETSTNFLNTSCTVQQTTTTDEISLEKRNKLTIECLEYIPKDNPKFKTKVNRLIEEIRKNFKDKIYIKNIEEILITNLEISSLNQLTESSLAVLAAIVLIIIMLFFIITFRKINGLFAAMSFLAIAIFNTSFYMAIYFTISSFLNLSNFEKFAFPLCAIIINLIVNATIMFSALQNKILDKTEQYPLKDSVNETINSTKFYIFVNFLIFCAIPSLSVLVFKIFSAIVLDEFISLETYVSLFAIHFISGFVLFLSSVFVILQLFSIFKKPKRIKKHKKEKQPLAKLETLN